MKNWVNRASSTSTCDDPLKVWCWRICNLHRPVSNLRRPVTIQLIHGVDVFHPTSTYLFLKSTCELMYVDVCSSKLYLWVLKYRRLFILLNVLHRRTFLLCRRMYFSFHVECRRICLVRRPVLFISTSVSVYVRTSVDVHPMRTLAVSMYVLPNSTCEF